MFFVNTKKMNSLFWTGAPGFFLWRSYLCLRSFLYYCPFSCWGNSLQEPYVWS